MTTGTVSDRQQTEKEMVERAQKHPAAFRYIYEAHFKDVFRFVYKRVGEAELAKDITQTVFVKALQALPRYKYRGAPILSWLFRIAINECLDFFRKSKKSREVVLDQALAEALYEELIGTSQREEWLEKLPAILSQLKPDEVTFLELRFFESRSFEEVAAIQGTTETNAKIKTYRILERVRKLFETRS